MHLRQIFDSVIMLTASNWFTEPRSNRYHYATRFSKEVPVYFVQFSHYDQEKITLEPSGFDNITIVHMSWSMAQSHNLDPLEPNLVECAQSFFDEIGCRTPLIWTYNPFAESLASNLHARLRVYHATENYLNSDEDFKIGSSNSESQSLLEERTRNLLSHSDLVIAVSDGVREGLERSGLAKGPVVEVRNGCDAEFWIRAGASEFKPNEKAAPVVLFQGGINRRVNFSLVHEVILNMPDWDFWFCGGEDATIEAWQMLKKHPNVHYMGALDSEEIAKLAKMATVGWVPFIDTKVLRTSLPLKMYEYVACGLPVVSVPINGLLDESDNLFRFAEGAEEFEHHIRGVASTRVDEAIQAERIRQARENGYDKRFEIVRAHMLTQLGSLSRKKNILVVYDEKAQYVNTIFEHLVSFRNYSVNNVFYVPGPIAEGNLDLQEYFIGDMGETLDDGPNGVWDFDKFDVIVIHYSQRLSHQGYLAKRMEKFISKSRAYKVLFIQDEYENTNCAKTYIRKLGINTIFTCIPPEGQEIIYPPDEFPNLKFVQTLTGFVPEGNSIEKEALPIGERMLDIGYRGRQLQHHYGQLGYDKYIIGERIREEAEKRGLKINISSRAEDRIYGSWYGFIGSCRATLGTESGANIFDFDGSLSKLAARLAEKSHSEVYEKYFEQHDNLIQMNQISPKFFEAIRLRTALICFRGYYSDILHPDVHYIPLEKDFSNLEDVFKKLADDNYLIELTSRAYNDVIESGKYSYKTFIRGFDDWLDKEVPFSITEVISAPIAIRRGRSITPILSIDSRDKILNTTILGNEWLRTPFRSLFSPLDGVQRLVAESHSQSSENSVDVDGATGSGQLDDAPLHEVAAVSRLALLSAVRAEAAPSKARTVPLPRGVRLWLRARLVHASIIKASPRRPWYFGALEAAWTMIPRPVKRLIGRGLQLN
jgi:glycosyltransferase involved in cell wall biosynthesis